jgi:hypothetical protein
VIEVEAAEVVLIGLSLTVTARLVNFAEARRDIVVSASDLTGASSS